MKKFHEALKQARLVTTHDAKKEALSGLDNASLRLVLETYNPYRIFGIKKWESPKEYSSVDDSLDHFFFLLDCLCLRKITGNAAKKAVTDILSRYTKETASELENVILKDLKCGAQAKTFEKIYNINIPKFDVMTCEKLDEKYKWSFPIIAEVKYDGLRLIMFQQNNEVLYFSRDGKPIDVFKGIFDEDFLTLQEYFGEDIVLDGEALASNFQETMFSKSKNNQKAKDNLNFYAFDVMSKREWDNQKCLITQNQRTERLKNSILNNNLTRIKKSNYIVCNDYESVKHFYDESVEAGFEGLIIKKYDSTYEWKRSKNWIKWKPVLDFDLEVVGIEKGSGKYENTLGSLILEGCDENGNIINTYVGSGFSDEQRDDFFKNPPIGKIVQIEAQEMCKAKNSDTFSLRFPVFVRIRDDK